MLEQMGVVDKVCRSKRLGNTMPTRQASPPPVPPNGGESSMRRAPRRAHTSAHAWPPGERDSFLRSRREAAELSCCPRRVATSRGLDAFFTFAAGDVFAFFPKPRAATAFIEKIAPV